MAVEKTFSISLDIKQPTSNRDIEVVEGDTGNLLVITLTDNGEAVNLTDCKVCAVFAKPDGHTAQQDTDGNGVTVAGEGMNEITIDLYNTSFSPGMVTCEIQVFSGADMETLVTSAQFNFKCRRGIANEDTIRSTDEWPLLVGLLNRVEDAEEELADLNAETVEAAALADAATERTNAAAAAAEALNAAAEAAEAGRAGAEQERAAAEAARNAAEAERTAAEQARIVNETARDVAEEAREDAELIREDAETARALAEEARQEAEAGRAAAEQERVAATEEQWEFIEMLAVAYMDVQEATSDANDAAGDANTAADRANTAAHSASAAAAAADTAADRANTAAQAAEDVVTKAIPSHAFTHGADGGDPLDPADIGAAKESLEITGTLPASGWSNNVNTVTGLTGVIAASRGTIGLAQSATAAQRTAARRAQLSLTAMDQESITVTADGIIPTVDIPFVILIVG